MQTEVTQQKGMVERRFIIRHLEKSPKLLSCSLMTQELRQQSWLKKFLVISH